MRKTEGLVHYSCSFCIRYLAKNSQRFEYKNLLFDKIFLITRTIFLTVGQRNFRNKILFMVVFWRKQLTQSLVGSIKFLHCYRIYVSMKVFWGKTINQIGRIFMKSHSIPLIKTPTISRVFFLYFRFYRLLKVCINNSYNCRNSKMQF